MNNTGFKIKYLILTGLILILLTLASCTTYGSAFQNKERVIPKGLTKSESCANYLFGIKLPYIGDTSIKLSGSESLSTAVKSGKITQPVIVDTKKVNWLVYNKKCVIIFGK